MAYALREGGERRAARGQQPDFVAVPDRADGVDHRPALGVVPAQEGQQDAHAEVESLEHEVSGPQDRDEDEPEGGEVHDSSLRYLSGRSVLEDGQRFRGAGLFGLDRGALLDVPDGQPAGDAMSARKSISWVW